MPTDRKLVIAKMGGTLTIRFNTIANEDGWIHVFNSQGVTINRSTDGRTFRIYSDSNHVQVHLMMRGPVDLPDPFPYTEAVTDTYAWWELEGFPRYDIPQGTPLRDVEVTFAGISKADLCEHTGLPADK